MLLAEAQHFVRPPEWTWYIFAYFVLAGLSGGSYVLATLFRLRGDPADEEIARLGFYAAFPPMVVSPLLLALDLGQPLRFWHMLWNTTPDAAGVNFKYWSPMSVGAWALVVFGGIATLSFLDTLARDRGRRFLPLGKVFNVVGSVFGLFIAGYTGVLLSVSNQPVWSDTWALGGLFLASSLSGAAALLIMLVRYRPAALDTVEALGRSARMYALLELALLILFVVTLIPAGTLGEVFGFPWLLLWIAVLAGLAPALTPFGEARVAATPNGAVSVTVVRAPVVAPGLALLGLLALRAVIIFSVQ